MQELSAELPPQQTAWGRAALLQAQELLAEARAIAVQQLELLHEDEALTRSAEHVLLSDSDTVLALSAKVEAGDWDGAARMLQNVSWARLSWRGGDAALKEEIKALSDVYISSFKELL